MINQTSSLVLRDLYSYDVVSAYPNILKGQHFDFKDINLENKTERNIFIGKSQIGNENLSSFLQESVDNLVKFYLQENQIPEEDIIITQKDGFIIKRMLENDNEFINMALREFIDVLILSPSRDKFIYLVEDKIIIKGVSHLYDEMEKFLQRFKNLNFYDKSILFEQMDEIKNSLFNSDNKSLFLIPIDDQKYIISTYKGDIQIKDPDLVSVNEINKQKYFDHFVKEFLESIYLECY